MIQITAVLKEVSSTTNMGCLQTLIHFVNQNELLASIRLPMGKGDSGNPHLLGILQDLKHWSLFISHLTLLCKNKNRYILDASDILKQNVD